MKYDFTPSNNGLHFDFATHTYSLANPYIELAGVTDIIRQAGLRPENGGNVFARLNGMNRGTNVHLATAFDDKGTLDESTLAPEYIPYLEQWRKFKRESGAQILSIELPLYSRKYLFAGTIDRIVSIGNSLYLLDIKTGGTPHISTSIQLAGYKILLSENFPKLKFRTIAVRITESNYDKPKEYPDPEKDARVFLSALECYWWARNNNLIKAR